MLVAVSGPRHLGESSDDECDCLMVAYLADDPETFEKTVESCIVDESEEEISHESCEKILKTASGLISDVFYVTHGRIGDASNGFERMIAYLRMLHPLVDTVMHRGGSRGNIVVEVRQEDGIPPYWAHREFVSNRFAKGMVECYIQEHGESSAVWIADCLAYALDRKLNHADDSLIRLFDGRPMECHPYDEAWRY